METITKFTLFILFLLSSITTDAQEKIDTIYYDKNWKGVSNKAFADYYRIAIYPAESNYKKQARDFFITGEIQGSGNFFTIDKFDDSNSIWDGECFSYFKNGKISKKTTWKNGKCNGEFINYSEDGLINAKGELINNALSGLYTKFLENNTFMQAEYIDGKPKYDYYIMGNKNGQLIKIKFEDNTPFWESPSVSEIRTQYQDGILWQIYVKNGLMIAQTNTTIKDHGKWHKVDLIITNNSMVPIEFDPEKDIIAYSIDKKENKDFLSVYSCEQYMKKVRRAQAWESFAVGLAEGLSTVNAGYSTSTTNSFAYGSSSSGNSLYSASSSSTTTYDANAAYQARILSQQRMSDFSDNQWNELKSKQMGYLKKNTIYPGESIQGYVHIKRISGIAIYITININNAEYNFAWTYGK